ncbi:ATP-binding protein [Pedobacter polaris]|nr:ATP-binding protein [Pedobacter polaris]
MTAILVNSASVLLLACIAFFSYEYYSFRKSSLSRLSTIGKIVAINSTASLAFKDHKDATEILLALKSEPRILVAALYDKENHLFAQYPINAPADAFPKKVGSNGSQYQNNFITLFQPIVQYNKQLGTLYIKYDMKTLYERFKVYTAVVILIIILISCWAYFLSLKLQQRIAGPILELAETARAISDDKDYSVRAVEVGSDELGRLTESFNYMIMQIEKQNISIVSINHQLEQSSAELQDIMDYSVDVICTLDRKGNFVKISAAAKTLWDYEPFELIGCNLKNLVHQDDIAGIDPVIELIINGEQSTNFENRFIRKDGKEVSMIWSARWKEKEKLIYCIARDATAIKNAEYKLQKRAKELAYSNEELEQFAYIASHDLQEPLRMVSSFLTQLEKKYKDQLDDKAKQYINFAVDGAVRMRRIILDLLEYSRIGKKKEHLELVDLNEVVNQVVQFCKTTIEEKGAQVIAENLPTVRAIRMPVQQMLQNLIGNALKYQKENVKPIVKIIAEEEETYWKISVIDNGIGIDPQFFDKIFLAFQRLHNNTEYSGSGIGLAICKKIAEKYDIQLWVESELDKGSIFTFTITKNNDKQ